MANYNTSDLSACMNTVKKAAPVKELSEMAIAVGLAGETVKITNRPWDKVRHLTQNGYLPNKH